MDPANKMISNDFYRVENPVFIETAPTTYFARNETDRK